MNLDNAIWRHVWLGHVSRLKFSFRSRTISPRVADRIQNQIHARLLACESEKDVRALSSFEFELGDEVHSDLRLRGRFEGHSFIIEESSPAPSMGDIAIPPGGRCMKWIRFFYHPKAVERVFAPIYADFWEEYIQAETSGRRIHACWIRVRFYWALGKTMGVFGLARTIKSVQHLMTA